MKLFSSPVHTPLNKLFPKKGWRSYQRGWGAMLKAIHWL